MDKIICIFGASSTWGAWDYEKAGWVNRLRLFLDSRDENIFTYNLGISGDTTEELIKRFDLEAKVRQPSIIIFSIGDNDSIYIKSKNKEMVHIKKFENNLNKLVEKSRKFAKTVIFLGCKKVNESMASPIPWETDYYYKNENLKLYDSVIKKVASKNKCYFLEVFNLLENKDLDDGLHPNSKGHEKLFLELKKFILKNKII